METIDLTKLTKEEIERDFVLRNGKQFSVLRTDFLTENGMGILISYLADTTPVIEMTKVIGSDGLSVNNLFDLIPRPVETFEKDEKVMARTAYAPHKWLPYHYSSKKEHHYVFEVGTSWNGHDELICCDVRKPTPEERAK